MSEENEAQAEIFLAAHPEFERLDAAALINARCEGLDLKGPYMQLRPDVHGTDGFFAAVFERRKNGATVAQAAEGAESEPAGQSVDAVAPESVESDLEPEGRRSPVSDPSSET
jgi:16S rRNA (cytosine967-C5)-methyltransferase